MILESLWSCANCQAGGRSKGLKNKFLASNENGRCLVKDSSIVLCTVHQVCNSTSVLSLLKHHSTSWGGQYNYANFQCGLAPRIYWYVFIYFMNSFIKNEIDYLVVCKLDDFNWIYISITFLSGNPLCIRYSWNSC